MNRDQLVFVSINPVQAFIHQARRTRDLWYGSYLLNRLCQNALNTLSKQLDQPEWIIPAHVGTDSSESTGEKSVPSSGLTNHVLVKGQGFTDAKAEILHQSILDKLREIADIVKAELDYQDVKIDKQSWDDQITHLLDITIVWQDMNDENSHFGDDYLSVGALMAATKRSVTFIHPKSGSGRSHWIKSSLNPGAYSVILDHLTSSQSLRLGIDKNEHLDALSIIKRLMGQADSQAPGFVSVSRIAVRPWLKRVNKKYPRTLSVITEIFKKNIDTLKASNLGNIISSPGQDACCPVDTPLYYPHVLERQLDLHKAEKDSTENNIVGVLDEIKQILKPLDNKTLGQPAKHYALVRGDGNQAGHELNKSAKKGQNELMTLSGNLSQFAASVRDIFTDFQGTCVFAGGDDALGIVPAETALLCAEKLAKSFYTTVGFSMSIAVVFGHVFTPLGELLNDLERGEKEAKKSS